MRSTLLLLTLALVATCTLAYRMDHASETLNLQPVIGVYTQPADLDGYDPKK